MTYQSEAPLQEFNSCISIGVWMTTITGLIAFAANPAIAQSISIDGSTSSTRLNNATSCSGTCSITGGTRSTGTTSNLFHSFSQFNVDNNAVVTFENPGVDNIFSRVTGNSLTNIDGTLKVEGTANFYLLNPNGIIFGDRAHIDIPGSFLATTADSILFENEQAFSATDTQNQSLLSVSVPLGLQFGTNPGPIDIVGNGHALTYDATRSFTITRATPSTGLISKPSQSLAFIGGEVSLQGGNIVAPSGTVDIGGVGSGSRVSFTNRESALSFDYSEVTSFEDISLSQRSSVDVSSSDAGSVRISGQNINIQEASAIFAKVEDSGDGNINLSASNAINVLGEAPSGVQPMITGAFVEIANGATGNGDSLIELNAETINIEQTGQIGLGIAGLGASGTVLATASTVKVDGTSATTPSSLYAAVLPGFLLGEGAVGQGGDLIVNADTFRVSGGAQISTSTFDGGNAGDLTINAKNIEVIGRDDSSIEAVSSIRSASERPPLGFLLISQVPPVLRFPSVAEGSGNGGTVTLNTERLTVSDAGQITAGTGSNNPGGSLIVNASESIELRGGDSDGRSGLFASALGDIRVPFNSTGAGGNISVNTPLLSVLDGATINASTSPSESRTSGVGIPSEGSAGDISITAASVNIKNGGFISADTVTGDRANINIQSDSLVLREGGRITTNATGSATGGNINITAEALIAFENSDITANATDNFGGRIIVNAPTIIGTAYREQLTTQSDITATSALGPAFSGSVELNSPEIDPTSGTVELPKGLNAEEQVVAACEAIDANTFIATGRGGLPEGPGQVSTGQSLWNDFRFLEGSDLDSLSKGNENGAISMAADVNTTENSRYDATESRIVEAQDWAFNNEGEIVLETQAAAAISQGTYLSHCVDS